MINCEIILSFGIAVILWIVESVSGKREELRILYSFFLVEKITFISVNLDRT